MRLRATATLFVVLLVSGVAPNWLRRTPIAVSAAGRSGRTGLVHITKNCTEYFAAHGTAGQFCTITSSTLPEIPAAATTRVYYDQAFGLPPIGAGFLDGNVLLYVGPGDWAVGRCTLDGNSGTGLCSFTDGIGSLSGFRARIDVAPLASGVDFSWDGTYNFRPDGEL